MDESTRPHPISLIVHQLTLPNPSLGLSPITTIEYERTVVIVGANGSGKTRLGAWLENPLSVAQAGGGGGVGRGFKRHADVYRIGALRALDLGEQAERKDSTVATQALHRGSQGPGSERSRVQGDPIVGQHTDFNLLLSALFAEKTDLAEQYMAKGEATKGEPGVPPKPKLTTLKETWERVFSERCLEIGSYTIKAALVGGGVTYGASRLSDGERVGFYLIGQALLAPASALIVVDEPEIHLHESIQGELWDAIENARTDCRFVYITHDLGFAASRRTAAKVVLFDYSAPTDADSVGTWTWALVPSTEDFPEDAKLRILGSRRPTLFCEGIAGGRDHDILTALFPDRYVVPVGGWEEVARAVSSFKALLPLHHLSVSGVTSGTSQRFSIG